MFLFSTITLLNSLTNKSGQSLFNQQDNELLFKGEGLYQVDDNHDIQMFKIEGHKEYRDIVDITNLESLISDPTNIYRIEFYIESNANADPIFSNALSRKSKRVFVEFNTIDSFYANLNKFQTMTYGTQLLTLVGELDGNIEYGKSTVTSAHKGDKGDENSYLIASNCYIRVMKAEVQALNRYGRFKGIGNLDIYHGSEGAGTQEDIMKNYILPTGYNNRFCAITTKDLPLSGELYDLFIIHYKVNRGNLGVHAVGQQTISKTTHCFFIKKSESKLFEDTITLLINSKGEGKKGPKVLGVYYNEDTDLLDFCDYYLGDPIEVQNDSSKPLYLILTEEQKNKLTRVFGSISGNIYDSDNDPEMLEEMSPIIEQSLINSDIIFSNLNNYTGYYLCEFPSAAIGLASNEVDYLKYIYDGVEYEVTLPPHDYSQDYLTLTALDSGTITFSINLNIGTDLITSISYSTDKGRTWTTTNNTNDKQENLQITVNVNENDKILWKGNALQLGIADKENDVWMISFFSSTCEFNAEGNIMSILYEDNFYNKISLENKPGVFMNLFNGCSIRSAKNLILPATQLAEYCYSGMFEDCTSLTTAPELPATTLADYCYASMFYSCTSLTTAPELPATTLADYCYASMFGSCTSLTTAPELPATTLAEWCYASMFYSCTSLTTAPELPATTLADYCYASMFSDCTSLTDAPELQATTLAEGCYSSMFEDCTSLTTAPELPATTLADYCYASMFYICTSLTTAPELPATTLADYCYASMFGSCTSLTTAPELPATILAQGCYLGMFSNCTNLNYIKCLATNISASDCTTDWINGVAANGTFVLDYSASWTSGSNGRPSGWSVSYVGDNGME